MKREIIKERSSNLYKDLKRITVIHNEFYISNEKFKFWIQIIVTIISESRYSFVTSLDVRGHQPI